MSQPGFNLAFSVRLSLPIDRPKSEKKWSAAVMSHGQCILGRLDATKRSQVMSMDRDDILNFFVVTNLPLPPSATLASTSQEDDDDLPFWMSARVCEIERRKQRQR